MVDALEGIRILDFTLWLFGPGSTQALGDFGAEVIKVEPPQGEPGRPASGFHLPYNGVSTGFMARNRNKKSICIDLRKPESKPIIRRLVETSDIAIQNFRPGVAERLGLTYEDFSAINPRLIYVVGTGYGPTGPYQHRGGQDKAAQAMSGMMPATGDPDWPPTSLGVPIIDFLGAMLLSQGMLLALRACDKTGKGQRVDVSLLDSAIAGCIESLTTFLNTGVVRPRSIRPPAGTYQTKDGWLQLITSFVRGGNPFPLVCDALGIEDLSEDPRFDSAAKIEANGRELRQIFRQVFLTQTTAEWIKRLDERGIISAPIYDFGQVFEDPQVQHNKMIWEAEHVTAGPIKLVATPVKLSDTPGKVHLPPPALGQHTDDVLKDLGFSAAEIAAFRAAGAVAGGLPAASQR